MFTDQAPLEVPPPSSVGNSTMWQPGSSANSDPMCDTSNPSTLAIGPLSLATSAAGSTSPSYKGCASYWKWRQVAKAIVSTAASANVEAIRVMRADCSGRLAVSSSPSWRLPMPQSRDKQNERTDQLGTTRLLMIVPRTPPEPSVVVVVLVVVVTAAVADGDHSGHGHGHDHVYDHDLLRLSRA